LTRAYRWRTIRIHQFGSYRDARCLFRPRSIAVIGDFQQPYSIGNIVIRNLLTYGFQGPIFPINPKARPSTA